MSNYTVNAPPRILDLARRYTKAGLSVIPIRPDGTKEEPGMPGPYFAPAAE